MTSSQIKFHCVFRELRAPAPFHPRLFGFRDQIEVRGLPKAPLLSNGDTSEKVPRIRSGLTPGLKHSHAEALPPLRLSV